MILTRGLLKLCSHALGAHPGLLKRITLHSAPLNLPLKQEGQLLICDITADSLLLSPWPLQPFIDVEEVEALSSAAQLPDLQPVHHTVSLKESNTYQPEFIFRKQVGLAPLLYAPMAFSYVFFFSSPCSCE